MASSTTATLIALILITAYQSAPRSDEPARASVEAIDPEATTIPYPFPVRYFETTVQRQQVRMAFMDIAATAQPNGRTAVLLHGKNFSGAYWESTVRALTAEGFRVVVPDQIGFGKSTKPASFQFSFQTLADTTRELLDSREVERCTLVGHSMGGMLAVRFALMFPERVEKLVLVNPIGLEDWKAVVPYRSVDASYAEELRATSDSIRQYMRENYFNGRWKPEYEPLIALPAGWTKHPEYPRIAWCAALTSDMIFTQPVVHEFPNLRVPTLLIIGQQDRTAIGRAWAPKEVARTLGDYPTLGKRAATAIPGATLIEIEGVGHLPQIEGFERYRDALIAFVR